MSSTPNQDNSYPASILIEAQALRLNKTYNKELLTPIENLPFSKVDILKPLDGSSSLSSEPKPYSMINDITTYILNTNLWKPSNDKDEMKRTLKSLRQAICKCPTTKRNIYFANGSKVWGKQKQFKKYNFGCIKSRMSPPKRIDEHSEKKRRIHTNTIRPTDKNQLCPCGFSIFANQYCFFIQIPKQINHMFHTEKDVHRPPVLKGNNQQDELIPCNNPIPNRPNRTIYMDGVFDLFHVGHLAAINHCVNLGNRIIIGITGDDDASSYKRRPIINQDERIAIVQSIKHVDAIICPCPLVVTEEFMDRHKIDLVVHGFANESDRLNQYKFFEIPIRLNKFQTIPYYDGQSTTDIIKKIQCVDNLGSDGDDDEQFNSDNDNNN